MKRNMLFRLIQTEWIKLKKTPILWLALASGLAVPVLMTLIYYFNPEKLIRFSTNPWAEMYQIGFNVINLVIIIPYLVLLSASLHQLEHQSGGWKYLYSLPVPRAGIYLAKIVMLVALAMLPVMVFLASSLLGGQFLSVTRPFYEFQFHPSGVSQVAVNLLHSGIASLGILGIHFWLGFRFKGYITPIALGLLGFIVSIIVFERWTWAEYFPYSFPTSLRGDTSIAFGLSSVEWRSLLWFAGFVGLGYLQERKRDVLD